MVKKINENWVDDELERVDKYNNPSINPITTKAFQTNLQNTLKDMSSLKRNLEALEFCLNGPDDDYYFPDINDAIDKLLKVVDKSGKALYNYWNYL